MGLQEVLIASGNPKKIREIRGLLAPLSVRVLTSDEVGPLPEVIEDAPTFAGNAAKKARETACATGLWCLADDSGLEVEALDGAPGVFSARFAGSRLSPSPSGCVFADVDGQQQQQQLQFSLINAAVKRKEHSQRTAVGPPE